MKKVILLSFLYLVSMNCYAGKYPGMTEQQCVEIDALYDKTVKNMQQREPFYTQAFGILNTARLLPYGPLEWKWPCDKLTCGPVEERNIFHFFWSRPLINVESLEGGCYLQECHPYTCCADFNHGLATYVNHNTLAQHFHRERELLRNVLGTSEQLRRPLPDHLQNKIPSYAEVFFLDYMYARHRGILMGAHRTPKGPIIPLQSVIAWSYTQPEVFDIIGKSLAYKISTVDNFTKFALIPFFNHITNVVQGASPEERNAAKAKLVTEIILGFGLDHHGRATTVFENMPNDEEINQLIQDNDHFGVINKMRELNMLVPVYDNFIRYLTSNNSWFAVITGELNTVRNTLNIQF